MRRRTFITTVATTSGIAALAGCLGDDEGGDEDDSDDGKAEGETQTSGSNDGGSESSEPAGSPDVQVVESELQEESVEYGSTDYTAVIRAENNGDATAKEPTVNIQFLNGDGEVLDSASPSTFYVKPGQAWEIRRSFTETSGTPDTIETTVEAAETADLSDYEVPDGIEVADEQLNTGNEPSVTATLENTGDGPLTVGAFAVFKNEEGTVITSSSDYMDGLAAGQTWSLSLETLITDEQVAQSITDYDLYFGL